MMTNTKEEAKRRRRQAERIVRQWQQDRQRVPRVTPKTVID